ncbi:phage tail tube protein [Azonexus sp. IMCC34839]|uniref:phage tail tube protein n=1 Tax=Azonexus sp. IMCC34839 TaxID=3133695 RepID=UPI00399C2143
MLFIAASFDVKKAVTNITNAEEAVISCENHGFEDGDIVQIYSGWGRLNHRAVRVKNATLDSFVAEEIDTRNTTFFPSGTGAGSVRKVLEFIQISKYLNPSISGGDPKPVTVKFMDEDTETTLNDGFSAVTESFEIDADQFGTPAYQAMVELSESQTDTILKKVLKSGDMIFTPCTIALNENVKLAEGSIMTNSVAVNGNGRITRYNKQ